MFTTSIVNIAKQNNTISSLKKKMLNKTLLSMNISPGFTIVLEQDKKVLNISENIRVLTMKMKKVKISIFNF